MPIMSGSFTSHFCNLMILNYVIKKKSIAIKLSPYIQSTRQINCHFSGKIYEKGKEQMSKEKRSSSISMKLSSTQNS